MSDGALLSREVSGGKTLKKKEGLAVSTVAKNCLAHHLHNI